MAKLLCLAESFPPILFFGRLILPLLTNDLGYLWIGETGILTNDAGLVVLAVEYKGYATVNFVQWE